MKPLVYIAGPITKGCQFTNVASACEFWEEMRRLQIDAYCPHWSAVQQLHRPISHAEWLRYDIEAILPRCDAMFRLPGESKGADEEVAWANEHAMPVFTEISKLAEWCEQYESRSNVWRSSWVQASSV